MKKTAYIIIAIVLALAFIFVGCSKKEPDPSEILPSNDSETNGGTTMKPDIIGEIIDIQNDNGLRILVESDADVIGQIWVSVNEETNFIDPQGNFTEPQNPSSLFEIGTTIAMLSNGTIMESYPMQTSADIVYLND